MNRTVRTLLVYGLAIVLLAVMAQWYEVTWGNIVNTREEIHALLEQQGLRLVARNYRCKVGELDVVGLDGGLKIERPPVGWAEVQAQLDRPVSRLLSRVATAAGMGARLSFAELRRVADEAAEREDRLEEAYGRLPCPMLVVLAGKADPVPHGEAMRAAVDTAASRLQQRHPEVKLARLACGHAIPLERPRELADLIIGFAESLPARS